MLSSSTPKILIEGSLVTPEPFKVKSKSYLQGPIGRACIMSLQYNLLTRSANNLTIFIYLLCWCQLSLQAFLASAHILSFALCDLPVVMDNPCPPNMLQLFALTAGLSRAQIRTHLVGPSLRAHIS